MKNLIFVLVSLLLTVPCAAEIIVVDDDWPYDFNNIQAAIDYSSNGDFIYVLPGTYTGTGNRDIDFKGKAVTVSGATGDPNDCIIDCQGSPTDRHRGFKFISGEDANSVIEAFTIKNGYGPEEHIYGGEAVFAVGGAIYCKDSSPCITNCIITHNYAWYYYGGGIFNINSSPTISNCLISNNTSLNGGGGISNYNSSPSITNCVISDNSTSLNGGGINNFLSYSTITNCTIINNSADYGGGIRNNYGNPIIKGCFISNNSAEDDGGGIHNNNNSPNIINCTIKNNYAGFYGGGVYNSSDNPNITNCIIWANTYSQIEGPATVTYSNVQGGCSGLGNINADPLFIDDYHIPLASPCFDAGDPNYVAGPNETDIDGDPRVMVRIDMGADEFCSSTSPLLIITPDILDFEAQGLSSPPQPQYVSIRNYGAESLNWQISELNDCNWLNAFPTSGQVNTGESNDAEITVDINMAGYGTHSCQLQVTAPGAENSPQIVPVNLEVLGPQIGIDNDYFYFTAYGKSDTSVEGQELIITNTGFDTLNWHIELTDCNWLDVSPLAGQVTDGNSVVAITVDPNKAPSYGYNYCTINIVDGNASNSPQAVTVRLQVLGPDIHVNPSPVLCIYAESNTKAEGTFEIINIGYDILHWNIETPNDCNWLTSVEPLSGEYAAGEGDIVTVTVDTNGLENNDYHTQLLIHSAECDLETLNLSLIVYTPSEIHVPQDYNTIQEAIDAAFAGDIIIVHPGTYAGFNDYKAALTIRSIEPEIPAVVAATIIESRGYVYGSGTVINGLSFIYNPNALLSDNGIYISKSSDVQIKNCRVLGFPRAGIYIPGQYPAATISNCVISNNGSVGGYTSGGINISGFANIENCLITDNFGCGILVVRPVSGNIKLYIHNSTIADNFYDTAKTAGRAITITSDCYPQGGLKLSLRNSVLSNIFGPNDVEIFINADNGENINLDIAYSNVRGGLAAVSVPVGANVVWGQGNIDAEPCFADPCNGDYHLKSQGWQWDAQRKIWTWDEEVTSRCIDAGNPGSPLGEELITIPDDPNNEWGENLRINMGAYGGTAEASMPPYDWALLADLTNDGVVNLEDFAGQAKDWLESESEQGGDLDRNGVVDINDLAMFVKDWLKQTSWSE